MNEHFLSLAQEVVGDRTNEIAEQLVEKKADFVLALKGNQKHLSEDTADTFTRRQPHKHFVEQEKSHGRLEKRSYKVIAVAENLADAVAQLWKTVCSLIRIEHKVVSPGAKPMKETRYYISSLDFNELSAREVAGYIREHWGIENCLHWQLDVTFAKMLTELVRTIRRAT